MSSTVLRDGERYFKIDNYVMKCRLYPNKEAARRIDDAIHAIQVFHNCSLYNIFNDAQYTTEKKKTNKKTGETSDAEYVHFADFKKIESVEYRSALMMEHPCIQNVPVSAITCKSGIIADMKKSIGKTPIEYQKPSYYNTRKPRTSYAYQESLNKVKQTNNDNVLKIDLCKVGIVNIRGWNQRIRFDESGNVNFVRYAMENKKSQVTIVISKDNCGSYWIVFKFPFAYKPMKVTDDGSVGLDVGVEDLATLSNGQKYHNPRFKKREEKHLEILSMRLSGRWGWSNIKFRDAHKKDKEIVPSKKYIRTNAKIAKIHRRIANQRKHYHDVVSTDIVMKHQLVAIETLSVQKMQKDSKYSYGLSDAAMYMFLSMISYKGNWYGRKIVEIGQYEPSTKKCSCCGHVLEKSLPPTVRRWKCQVCGKRHDRDVNAAVNILNYALKTA